MAIIRTSRFHGQGPKSKPTTVLARVRGKFIGNTAIVVAPGEMPVIREANNKLAWIVVWRDVPMDAIAPGIKDSRLTDTVVFVDAGSGEVLDFLLLGTHVLPEA